MNEMKKQIRTIAAIIPPPAVHMVGDGFKVHNFFPSQRIIGEKGMSPWFLLDYNAKWDITPGEKPRGVGVHPHRGIETVTIAYHGKIAHHDSGGNSGIIGEGDVQWMTAGGGVLHKEYHEKEFSRKGGILQMVQLWVNLPKAFKRTPAKYQAIENKDMSRYPLDDGKSFVELITGDYKGISGPASSFSPMNMFNARLIKGSVADFSFDREYNTGILMIEGEIKINNSEIIPENNFALFKHDGEVFIIEAVKDSIVLILSGKPIDEPVSAYGPFVMNTEEEIKEAYQDYFDGKFGYLED
jgi:hypothetical protein